ncbi:CBU_0592 family membrane protein [Sphingomonas sp.]|uniref:CBU_0592 family membrane protein n=1 Tax=Sphingomonas sp. TaxID=28214 RepID=UPI003B3A896B
MPALTPALLIELAGWAGSIAVLLAYALLSTGRLRARSWAYQLMNVFGALGMAINGWAHMALPSVFNNVIWITIGLFALARLLAGSARPQA